MEVLYNFSYSGQIGFIAIVQWNMKNYFPIETTYVIICV